LATAQLITRNPVIGSATRTAEQAAEQAAHQVVADAMEATFILVGVVATAEAITAHHVGFAGFHLLEHLLQRIGGVGAIGIDPGIGSRVDA
jgi:hypothetical protein